MGARKSSARRSSGLGVLQPTVILASASPRRTELLTSLGVAHQVLPADIDETPYGSESALAYVRRMAVTKARTISVQVGSSSDSTEEAQSLNPTILAADTIVVADGAILGKPQGEQDGLAMIARLSGRTHQVVTAVCLCHGVRQAAVSVCTDVSFRSVSLQEARGYWASGEPLDKAGGYGIQGSAARFVSKIDGSYTGVIGLPLVETRALFLTLGIDPGFAV